jgi:hypothetical protein
MSDNTYNYALSTSDLLPVKGNTPFGYYDNDPSFQNDAQKACFYVTRRLGYGVVDVELIDYHVYAAYEEAVTTYGNEVYLYKIRENYLSMEGAPTDMFLCDYNITYKSATLYFNTSTTASAADFKNDPTMTNAINNGSIFYRNFAPYYPALSLADSGSLTALSLDGLCSNALARFTYFDGTNINIFTDSRCNLSNTTASVSYIPYKSDYNMNNRVIDRSLGGVIRVANKFADQAFLSEIPTYSASISLEPHKQTYDVKQISALDQWMAQGKDVVITRVFYEDLPAIAQYNNPFPGLGGVSAYPDGWGLYNGYSGNNFIVWPVYFDVQRIQEIEMAKNVRSSGFSFSINNNNLTVFPRPETPGKLWIEYADRKDILNNNNNLNSNTSPKGPTITDVTKVPYSNPVYTEINSVGRTWIMKYTLAICKEILGYSRGKYPSADIPKIGAMNSSDLMSQSQAEKDALLTQLREFLDMTSRRNQLERQKDEVEFSNEIMRNIPLPSQIYIL